MLVPWKYLTLFPLTFAYTSIAGYTNVLNILNPHSPISDWMSTTIIVCYAESGKWAGFLPEDHLKRRDLHCFLCYNLSLHRCTQFSIFPTFFFSSTLQFVCPVMCQFFFLIGHNIMTTDNCGECHWLYI